MNTPPQKLTVRISWLGILNYLGAVLATGWMLYFLYSSAGMAYAVLALLVCGVVLRFGASPLLIISATVLYFHFDAAGFWLPLIAWLAAGAAFLSDLRAYRMRQASGNQPSGK